MSSLKSVPRNKLESQLEDLTGSLGDFEATVASIRTEFETRLAWPLGEAAKLRIQIKEIRDEISRREAMDAVVPSVSDHALLRYIERVHDIDIEAIRSSILEKCELGIRAGASSIKTEACTFVVKGSTVVTVMTGEKALTKVKKMTRAQREIMEAAE